MTRRLRNWLIFDAIMIFVLLFLVRVDRDVRNVWGDIHGFAVCPQCGDSFGWKTYDAVQYAPGSGFLICEEDLRGYLDETRVISALFTGDFPWPADTKDAVRQAVRAHNHQHLGEKSK